MPQRLARALCQGGNHGIQTDCAFPRNGDKGHRSAHKHCFAEMLIIYPCPDMLPSKAVSGARGSVEGSSSQGVVKFMIRALPIPVALLTYILDNISILRRLRRERDLTEDNNITSDALDVEDDQPVDVQGDVERTPTVKPEHYWTTLQEKCKEAGGDWVNIADQIWAFGPHGAGGCLLVDSRSPVSTNS
jgi:ribosome assembly protein 1